MNGNELLSSRTVGDISTAVALIDSFKREFPKGEILIEDPVTFEASPLRKGAELTQLFA